MPAAPRTIRLDPADNLIVAVDPLEPGFEGYGARAAAKIPRGHKMAVERVPQGAPLRKFGQIIGFATRDVAPGEHVHTHNCEFAAFARDYAHAENARPWDPLPIERRRTFQGYRRADGRAGTRNYIGILTSVNCSASVARFMAEALTRSGILDDYPEIDGVVPFVHGTGCGMAAKGEGYDILQRTSWGYATNPNVGAVLLVGLGCEVFQIAEMKKAYGIQESDKFRSMTIQDTGGTRKTIEAGVAAIKEMLPTAAKVKREPIPASELMLALQCGGSDGYSGITANPALGAAVDLLVEQGGTAILSETPEIYGAEHLLTRRAASREVGEKLIEIIKWWEGYTAKHGGSMDNNPSPGNKAGGLTTILEKSLGAAAKGGTTTLRGVYRYAERVDTKGFVFMDTPGYDPTSATGQVAGGANVLCFTTGRGSAYGCAPSPSLKFSTNTALWQRQQEDIDLDCGGIVDGLETVQDCGERIFQLMLQTASGRHTLSELHGYGQNEFVPWQLGAVM